MRSDNLKQVLGFDPGIYKKSLRAYEQADQETGSLVMVYY